jgi:hypothetical protein
MEHHGKKMDEMMVFLGVPLVAWAYRGKPETTSPAHIIRATHGFSPLRARTLWTRWIE